MTIDEPGIEIVVDPHPSHRELNDLWRMSWEIDGLADFDAILTRSLVHIGAYSGSMLVGFANVAWDGGVHAFLVDVCVHPDHRDHGVGQAMVEKAIAVARARGAKWIHADFEPHLRAFYRSCGFEPVDAGVLRIRD